MPLVELPTPQIGEPGFDDAARKLIAALKKALNWSVQKGSPLRLKDHPGGFELGFEFPPPVRPFRLTSALASGTAASPTSASANAVYWTGSAYNADTTVAVTVRNKYTLPATLAIGSDVDAYFFMGEWHMVAAKPC